MLAYIAGGSISLAMVFGGFFSLLYQGYKKAKANIDDSFDKCRR